jgi:hypothetical protein
VWVAGKCLNNEGAKFAKDFIFAKPIPAFNFASFVVQQTSSWNVGCYNNSTHQRRHPGNAPLDGGSTSVHFGVIRDLPTRKWLFGFIRVSGEMFEPRSCEIRKGFFFAKPIPAFNFASFATLRFNIISANAYSFSFTFLNWKIPHNPPALSQ